MGINNLWCNIDVEHVRAHSQRMCEVSGIRVDNSKHDVSIEYESTGTSYDVCSKYGLTFV